MGVGAFFGHAPASLGSDCEASACRRMRAAGRRSLGLGSGNLRTWAAACRTYVRHMYLPVRLAARTFLARRSRSGQRSAARDTCCGQAAQIRFFRTSCLRDAGIWQNRLVGFAAAVILSIHRRGYALTHHWHAAVWSCSIVCISSGVVALCCSIGCCPVRLASLTTAAGHAFGQLHRIVTVLLSLFPCPFRPVWSNPDPLVFLCCAGVPEPCSSCILHVFQKY